MGPTPREGFNAKARQSGSKKGRGRRKPGQGANEDIMDSNAPLLVPKSVEDREALKKQRLQEELLARSDSKWSTKKKRRLEKYIDKKLKKEERVVILEKLSQTQAEMPSTLHLQSSATLGTGKPFTHQERFNRLEDKEIRLVLDGRSGKRKRGDQSYVIEDADVSDDAADHDGTFSSNMEDPTFPKSSHSVPEITSGVTGDPPRKDAAPSKVPRPIPVSKKPRFRNWESNSNTVNVKPTSSSNSDSSFDSSDSEHDDPVLPSAEGNQEQSNSESESESEADLGSVGITAPKSLGFKDWAVRQLHVAKGYDPPALPDETSTSITPVVHKPSTRHQDSSQLRRGPLGEDVVLPVNHFTRTLGDSQSRSADKMPTETVSVARTREVQESRLLLPIVSEEQAIMEAVLLNPVVIICGETGSGKTTQVPQFLYEAGFGTLGSDNPGMIGITQPRRVAAMSMASRVAHELALSESKVSYQIRYDATVSPTTSIKFMTDGVLMRELATDFLLSKYSVIIIDEAHERSLNTDILIGVLSRVVKLREEMWRKEENGTKPLRLIIMSATLRVAEFTESKTLFETIPPVINVTARQHPITVHFSRRTSSDYVNEAIKKATKIHSRLPPGGILIFLTGQNEISGVCRKLEQKFGKIALENKRNRKGVVQDLTIAPPIENRTVGPALADVESEEFDFGGFEQNDVPLDEDVGENDPDALDSDEDEDNLLNKELGIDSDDSDVPMHVLPLYSLLPSEKQMLVFQPPPEGTRLVVVSTNVAETSVTIPGIRYVVDCGRAKERTYNHANGIQAFQVSWISKASASQRAGRAGRTGPGHCYRLYSSPLFEHYFDQFSRPEILRMPIEGVVLQMKSMRIDAVPNFPFPTPPERATILKAESLLTHLGALNDGNITNLGSTMSLFPLSPRFSRMLVSGQQHRCLPYVIAIVSLLSVGDPFLHNEVVGATDGTLVAEGADGSSADKKGTSQRGAFFKAHHLHASLGGFTSDIFKILSVVGAYEYAGGGLEICKSAFVRPKAMEEIHKLRVQLSNIVRTNFPGVDARFDPKLAPPNDLQLKVLRQLLAAAFIDQVAIRKDRLYSDGEGAMYASAKGVPYKAMGISEDVFIHPSSVIANLSPPDYLIFTEVVQTTRIWLKNVTVVNPVWLSSLAKGTSLCTLSKPVRNKDGILMTIPRFGTEGWELPAIKWYDLTI